MTTNEFPAVQQLRTAVKAIVDTYAQVTRQVVAAFKSPAFATLVRRVNDHDHITRIANQERAVLADWWENHLDEVYADLGLDRKDAR